MIEMFKFIKGLEKSMIFFRINVIVRGVMVIFVFYKRKDTWEYIS